MNIAICHRDNTLFENCDVFENIQISNFVSFHQISEIKMIDLNSIIHTVIN